MRNWFIACVVFPLFTPACLGVNPQSYAARIIGRGTGGNEYVGTVTYVKYQTTGYIVTAYHNVYKTSALWLAFDESSTNRLPILDFVEPIAELDPIHDLALFRCTPDGEQRLQGTWKQLNLNLRPIVLKAQSSGYSGTHVIAVGNPIVSMLRQNVMPLNIVAGATVSEYSALGKRLPRFANDSVMSNVNLVFLEGLQVTHGFSGGPVIFSESQFRLDDGELVGMVEGGDPGGGGIHSWAIPVDAISNALTKTELFHSFPPTNWPDELLTDNAFSRTDTPFITVLQVTPWKSGTRGSVPLQVSQEDELSITLRAAGNYKQLAAILHIPHGMEILKSPDIAKLRESGLFSFIWTVRPSVQSKGGRATIEFRTESGDVSFTLPLDIRVVNETNSGSDEQRALAILPEQIQEIKSISRHFDGMTELDLRDEFGFDEMFEKNMKVVFGSYRLGAFHENYDLKALLPGTTIKFLQGGGGLVDLESGKITPKKSGRLVKALLIPDKFMNTSASFKKFADSTFLTPTTSKLISDYVALADENTIILGDVLNEAEAEMPKRYPKASDEESDVWIKNLWAYRFKNLSPKAREIQEDLRGYAFGATGAGLQVDGEPVNIDFRMKNNTQHSGCACGNDEISFPGDLSGKIDEPLNFRYDGSEICRGQDFKDFDGYISWTGSQVTQMRNQKDNATFPGIAGTVKVTFSQPGSYNIRASFSLKCLDINNCVNPCSAQGHTVVNIK